MTLTHSGARNPPEAATDVPDRRGGHRIDDWRPEDPWFWEKGGRRVARRNLAWSIFAEHLGFSVWLISSVSSAFLLQMGFAFTSQQLFLMVALPNLVGSVLRLPYTFAADVTSVTVYRVASADDPEPMFAMVDLIADWSLDAVTFTPATSSPGRRCWRCCRRGPPSRSMPSRWPWRGCVWRSAPARCRRS